MEAQIDQIPSSGRITRSREDTEPTTRPRRKGAPGWLIPAGLLALSTPPLAFGTYRLFELVSGAVNPTNARYFESPIPVVLHIVGAMVFALLGAFQFSSGFRRRHPGWHRFAGRGVVIAGLAVGLSALWMTVFYPQAEGTGDLLAAFRLLFGSAMVGSIALSFAAIRRGDVRRHRAWIMRGYALGLGAGTQMFTLMVGEIVAGPPDAKGVALLQAAAWVINLAVAEWRIRRRPGRRSTASTSA